jgi:hypothetical protein
LGALDVETLQRDGGQPAQAVALLALVAGQDVEPADGSDGTDGRWRIAGKVAYDRVISTVDPDSRHAHKTHERRQDGFKTHIVIEPDTGLVTAAKLTKAAGPDTGDAAVGIGLLSDDTTIDKLGEDADAEDDSTGGDEPALEVLGDSAYGTGAMLAALDTAGYRPVIKPWPLRAAIDGGFTVDDFVFDVDANTLTCPNGVTRTLTKTRDVVFGVACRGCPLRDRCTTSASGRTVRLAEHEALQRAHRARARTDDFQATYRQHRPMVERTIAWLTRRNRRVPYRGVTKNNAWISHRVAALNLRRLITLGLVATNNGWALIPT